MILLLIDIGQKGITSAERDFLGEQLDLLLKSEQYEVGSLERLQVTTSNVTSPDLILHLHLHRDHDRRKKLPKQYKKSASFAVG